MMIMMMMMMKLPRSRIFRPNMKIQKSQSYRLPMQLSPKRKQWAFCPGQAFGGDLGSFPSGPLLEGFAIVAPHQYTATLLQIAKSAL